jgi:hypothetical protein
MREFLPIIVGSSRSKNYSAVSGQRGPDLETRETMIERKRSSRIMRPARDRDRSEAHSQTARAKGAARQVPGHVATMFATMFELTSATAKDAARMAKEVMRLGTALARISRSLVERRDSLQIYYKITHELTHDFDDDSARTGQTSCRHVTRAVRRPRTIASRPSGRRPCSASRGTAAVSRARSASPRDDFKP